MLYYKTHGEGKPIYLLHGWALNSRVWDDVLPELTQYGQVFAVDLPGHGKSDLPADGQFDLDTMADEIAPILENDSIVVGWSLGGLIALNLAYRYPELINKLVLVAGSPQFVQSEDWPNAVDKAVIEGFAQSLQRDYRTTILRFLAIQALGSEQAKQSIKALRDKVFINGEPKLTALEQGLNLLINCNLRPVLSDIHCPSLVIVGEKDTLIPEKSGYDTSALLANSQLAIVNGAGHAPFISHPQEFLNIITAFINETTL
ncbi:pimeloyl-ACP methyl ester esterase BioH [Kaarinaea lacus]